MRHSPEPTVSRVDEAEHYQENMRERLPKNLEYPSTTQLPRDAEINFISTEKPFHPKPNQLTKPNAPVPQQHTSHAQNHKQHPFPLSGRSTAATPSTAKIATKGHKQRTSLLGGSGNDYTPLGGGSISSTGRTFTDPYAPGNYPAGGYHDRQGLVSNAAAQQRKESRMYVPSSRWTWAFTLIAVIQAVICLGLEAYVFGEFEASLKPAARGPNPPDAAIGALTIPTYLAIFIFGFIYQLILVWDALRLKNTIQVIGICIYNLGMMIYAAVEMDQVDEAVTELGDTYIDPGTWNYLNPCLIATPCVLALGTVLMSFVAWKLYDEFAWTIYKHISADLRLKKRYLTYQIYIALLKFDFFFFLGFTVQFLVVVRQMETYEFALTIAALPVTVILLFLAAIIVRRENYAGHAIIILLYFAGMAYFIFKLVRMYDSDKAIFYQAARHSLTTFSVLAILLLVATIATAIECMRNFNKGLRPHIQRRKVPDVGDTKYSGGYASESFAGQGQQHQLGAVPSRMTID